MSGYRSALDRHQTVMFPASLDEYVAPDHPVRVIDAFVEGLDMQALEFAHAQPGALGAPCYDPRALLKLYVYAYLNRLRSSRRLERETHRNVEVMWLLGRQTPDHKTISDFRAAHGEALRGVFREFTVICKRLELFGGELVAIDGSKLRAVNAKHRSFTPDTLRALLKRIDERIAEYLRELDAADRADAAAALPGSTTVPGLRGKLDQLQERREEYQKLLTDLTDTGKSQVTLTDPESRRMKVKQGVEVCYNAQIAVDSKYHLIVAQDVTNEVTDIQQLAPMAEAAKEALGVSELAAVADAGYHSDDGVAKCVEKKITPTVPASQTGKAKNAQYFTKADFTYVPERDVYRCPGEQELPKRSTNEDGSFYYNISACTACPLRGRCINTTSETQHRRIKRTPHEGLLDAMAERLRAHPELRVQRKSLAEHPYGTIKRSDDGGYFFVRGLVKVRGEFSLMTLAYNLRRAITILGVSKLLHALMPPKTDAFAPLPI